MNMHAASGLCTHVVSNIGGVTAGPARLNSSNVGVSLRARWDMGQVGHISGMIKKASRHVQNYSAQSLCKAQKGLTN